MSDRTPQQALKDAIDSGAVAAWIRGERLQTATLPTADDWLDVFDDLDSPRFYAVSLLWRPCPQNPTIADWRPVVKGQEPKEDVVLLWTEERERADAGYFWQEKWYYPYCDREIPYAPTHFCPLPEPPST